MASSAKQKTGTQDEHMVIHPSILYAGNPVVLITTVNSNGTANISPMSSTWELGDRLVLGMTTASQGYENLKRERECVVNFPSSAIWQQVEQLARDWTQPGSGAQTGYWLPFRAR